MHSNEPYMQYTHINKKDEEQNAVEQIVLGYHTKCQRALYALQKTKNAMYTLNKAIYSRVRKTGSRMP